ncbi:MAG TPA: DUF882 domain-containing protein [Stellaceae bacterium]|nr:DUF882 domain-containing protein [Stellaceae bacterium]
MGGGNEPRRPSRRLVVGALGAAAAFTALPGLARAARGERSVSLLCPETGESFKGVYWADGLYVPDAFARIDWLMRDFHRNRVASIDPRLVDLMHSIALRLGTRHPVRIYSGFRTRETNLALRHEGMPAASNSEHLVARAADIAVEGVSAVHLHRVAVALRQGGVGAYDHYVHVDTGPVRDWSYYSHPHHHR